MSTSDQQGNQPLTRKQMREIRLTGATPVISEEESTAAAAPDASTPETSEQSTPKSKAKAKPKSKSKPKQKQPEEKPAEVATPPQADADKPHADDAQRDVPLTRRQVREQERMRTASVPVITAETPEAAVEQESELVSGVPAFAAVDEPAAVHDSAADVEDESAVLANENADEDDDADEEIVDAAPVSAAAESTDNDLSAFGVIVADDADEEDSDAAPHENEDPSDELPVADPVVTGETPVVSPTFGKDVLGEQADVPAFTPSFDELITSDSGGSQSRSPNTLIFTPSPGEGSLSGPVASTGEVLVTGSYELPHGIGSQGHAHGAADGMEIDAVLIDGELPPSSSPTPIAASSAVSTIKPAGEVIRPPAPEKGNKLMLTLAITAGGLALVLAAALIIAFTTNVFS